MVAPNPVSADRVVRAAVHRVREEPVMLQYSSSDAVRWQRALDRALANALDVLIEPISGEAFVESATNPGTLYQVTATSCTCPAGQAGIPCQHRACYLAQTGELAIDGMAPVENCPDCHGAGVIYSREYELA